MTGTMCINTIGEKQSFPSSQAEDIFYKTKRFRIGP